MKTYANEVQKDESDIIYKLNRLEQYDRRLNLRIFGLREEANESTDEIVLDIARKLDIPIFAHDISCSHRAGAMISTAQDRGNIGSNHNSD
ncbi:unnamed protein product [Didymodactylos carnosus]|uniref:Uncharacterized protein n=1 Tax=Didymodactylos carnosus TaxID=1234261 RepID=A0A815T3X7_9BILA|nr:unnamed protein product [Didymodactylos carnosus]CAF1591855.1 unnamed protein product [Didymodactylos carnosus]CAF4363000.1 unnamed protein product [Didymodactylos carnosus]CAF4396221.1 unnamed protein product [Didymodactylos carnosus]